MSRRRLRQPHPLAKAEVVRAVLAEVRTHFPALSLKNDATVIKFLRAALHATTKKTSSSRLGRPPRWSCETLRAVPPVVLSCLRLRGAGELSFSSFVKHFCPLLSFPSDVLAALEASQVTLFEAEQLARVVPGRLGLQDARAARQQRAALLAVHLRTRGSSHSLRQRLGSSQTLETTKESLKLLAPAPLPDAVAEIQREIDEYAAQVEKMDYTFLFVDELTYIVQNMLRIDVRQLADTDVDRLLAKLDDVVTVVRELTEKSRR